MLLNGLLALSIGVLFLLAYALLLLKSLHHESTKIRDKTDEIHTQGEVHKSEIGNLAKPETVAAGMSQSGPALKAAILQSLDEIQVGQKIGQIKTTADQMATSVSDIQKIFLEKQSAAGWAEIELERLLDDTFSRVQIRKKVPFLETIPDAHLCLADGKVVCIDAKFPINAFRGMLPTSEGGEGEEDGRMRRSARKKFLDAVAGHINKVESSYIRPGEGTVPVAYLYIPSERIYFHLVDADHAEESELVRDAARRGVVICSPSTLIANMHLLHIADRAIRINEKSDEILKAHDRLRTGLDDVVGIWETLGTHINNAYTNREKLQTAVTALQRTVGSLETFDLGGDGDVAGSPQNPV